MLNPSYSQFHTEHDPARGHAERHLRALSGRVLAYVGEREAASLARLRAHLLDVADAKSAHVTVQNLRSISVLLDKHAGVFNRAFQSALQAAMHQELEAGVRALAASPAGTSVPSGVDDALSMSLVDIAKVERTLLLDRVAQRFTEHYEASLTPLTLRLAVLLGLDEPSLSRNPFRPEVFVHAYLAGWEQSALDNQLAQELVQALDPLHCIDLAPLYADLDARLTQSGIAAQPAYRIKRSVAVVSARGVSSERAANAPGGPPSSAWSALVPAGRNIAAQARQFLQRLGLRTASAGEEFRDGGRAPVRIAADPEFMGYLGNIQASADASLVLPMLDGQDPRERNLLRQMRDREEVRRAPELDRGTVDALAEVFDFVFADQSIPLQMKFVIGRMQIPVLKAAMIDRDFFLSTEHPARRLVDTLALASIAWAPEKGENDPLYVRVENTVKRVLNEFEDDLTLFRDLLAEFTEFLFETEQQAQHHIEPVVRDECDAEAHALALVHADDAVHACIQALPAQLPLAPFLVPFLTTKWREVLARAWLRRGDGPSSWDAALRSMEQLIWSTQPKTGSEDRRRLVAILPDLVRTLNAALDQIDWSGEERARFTRRLIATHMLAIRMTKPSEIETDGAAQDEEAGKSAMQALDRRRASRLAASEDGFDLMAKTFTRGLWFDFVVDKATRHRCRLSWVSPMRTRLLFTNREGFDAFVRSEREVAALLRHGRLTLLDQVPIVGRALDQIMSGSQALRVA